MALSALITSEPHQDFRWQRASMDGFQRFGKILKPGRGGGDIARDPQTFERSTVGERREHGHGSASVRYLDRLTGFDEPEELAGSLTQFPHTNRCHVLVVAHGGRVGPRDQRTRVAMPR